ncbi:hypothetical protein PV721_38805 [Streptomyces sp. MB09-01]|uniref:hypothetical protein n=1 Tax=Streptomyces sp. MB09-01 TaxID=3028666 RepID=UPI0029B86949|nr:hypothetical protein [Streptomyces sp. MB09-01]MDX3540155.1 hypothetical protein [Streptomyces sp. MB09-01]
MIIEIIFGAVIAADWLAYWFKTRRELQAEQARRCAKQSLQKRIDLIGKERALKLSVELFHELLRAHRPVRVCIQTLHALQRADSEDEKAILAYDASWRYIPKHRRIGPRIPLLISDLSAVFPEVSEAWRLYVTHFLCLASFLGSNYCIEASKISTVSRIADGLEQAFEILLSEVLRVWKQAAGENPSHSEEWPT